MKNIIQRVLLAISLISVVNLVNATPVEWILDSTQTNFSFIKASGTFTFDADTGTYTNSAFNLSQFSQPFAVNSGDANSLNFGIPGNTGIFTFIFDTPLTNAGGIVTGVAKFQNPSSSPFNFSVHTLTPVPEPDTYAAFLAGLGLLGFVTRRKLV